MKKYLIIIGVIFGIINIIACGNTVDTTKAEKVDNFDIESDAETENEDTETEEKVFKIGEEIKLDNTLLTITGIEKTNGAEYDRKSGIEYIIISFKLKNVSKKERVSYSTTDFKMENSKGILQSDAFLSTLEDFDDGELTYNGEFAGKVAFESPVNDPKLTLEYQPNMFEKQVIRVKLNY